MVTGGFLEGEQNRPIHKWELSGDGELAVSQDSVIVEKSFQLFIKRNNEKFLLGSVLATPIDLRELGIGFIWAEKILNLNQYEMAKISVEVTGDEIIIHVAKDVLFNLDVEKLAISSSPSCGWCGRTSIEDVISLLDGKTVSENVHIDIPILLSIVKNMTARQKLFKTTGGVHAAGLFAADGSYVALKEDVGRHNALDKAIGAAIIHYNIAPLSPTNTSSLPYTPAPSTPSSTTMPNPQATQIASILALSGRAGMELIHKAAVANIEIVICVGAPTSASIDLARHAGISLLGFAKDNAVNVYTHPKRFSQK